MSKPKALLIAEKPSLMRTIRDVAQKHASELDYDITFISQAGHLYRLKQPDELSPDLKKWSWDTLPLDPDKYGGFQYTMIESSKDLTSNIKKELDSKKYDVVINAGDPDQEGELLIRETLMMLKNKLPVLRFWSNDLTEMKVLNALKNLKDDDKDPMCVNLFHAAIARQHSDYRVGMNGSRASTLKMNIRVAVGRVKATVLAMVCKREIEIKNFKPTTVYGVKINYAEGFSGRLYNSVGAKPDTGSGKEGKDEEEDTGVVYFKTKAEADKFIKEHTGPTTVTVFEGKNAEKNAPKLLKLATAQIAAGKLGYDSAKTLEIIQSLYEQKVLSYPRTDCEYISSNEDYGAMLESAKADPALAGFIEKIPESAIKAFKTKKAYVNDKALTESGHSALTPTDVAPDWSSLTKAQKDIYDIIARQYVAAFFPPLVQKKTTMLAELSDGSCFKSTGTTLVDKGYTEVFGTKTSDTNIPEHKKGDSLGVKNFENAEKTSRCPKRFKDPDLIAACENPKDWLNDESLKKLGKALSIGTPATRAGIITQLIEKDKYIAKGRDGYLSPTDIGMKIYENLKDFKICQVDLTGEWEEKLEDIRHGRMSLEDMENEMKQFVAELVEEIKNSTTIKEIGQRREIKVIGSCPKCGGRLLSYEKGISCENWNKENKCQYGTPRSLGDGEPLTDEEYLSMQDGTHITKMLKKKGHTWMQELCVDPETGRVSFVQKEHKVIGKCRLCGGDIWSTEKGFCCSNWKAKKCKFGSPRIFADTTITDEEYLSMLDGAELEKEMSKNGKTWTSKLTTDETGRIVFNGGDGGGKSVETSFKCPKCKAKKLRKGEKNIFCSCGFKLWLNQCGHELTDDEIKQLVSMKKTQFIDMVSPKKGTSFRAQLKLKSDRSGKTEFIFEKR